MAAAQSVQGLAHLFAVLHAGNGLPLGILGDGREPASVFAKTEIFDYIESYYDQHRKHSALNYQSPTQFEAILHSLN